MLSASEIVIRRFGRREDRSARRSFWPRRLRAAPAPPPEEQHEQGDDANSGAQDQHTADDQKRLGHRGSRCADCSRPLPRTPESLGRMCLGQRPGNPSSVGFGIGDSVPVDGLITNQIGRSEGKRPRGVGRIGLARDNHKFSTLPLICPISIFTRCCCSDRSGE